MIQVITQLWNSMQPKTSVHDIHPRRKVNDAMPAATALLVESTMYRPF